MQEGRETSNISITHISRVESRVTCNTKREEEEKEDDVEEILNLLKFYIFFL